MTHFALKRTVVADVDAVLDRLKTALTAEEPGVLYTPEFSDIIAGKTGDRLPDRVVGPGPSGPRNRPGYRCAAALRRVCDRNAGRHRSGFSRPGIGPEAVGQRGARSARRPGQDMFRRVLAAVEYGFRPIPVQP